MGTRGSNGKAWPRRVLAIVVAALTIVAPLGLAARGASAAPPPRSTTTTTSTTTTAPPGGGSTGGTTTTSGATPKLTAVVALSRHRVLATYDRDLDSAALQASNYAFYSTQAVNLPVTGVARATNNQAFVMTGPQEAVTYEVRKPRTPRPVTFKGSLATEPRLVAVRAVSRTQILVSFSEPVGSDALQPSSYQITVQGTTTGLGVLGATMFGPTQKEILLTTDPQQGIGYVLKVADIQGAAGTYMDPTANSLQFSGSTVVPGPMLLTVRPDGDTRLILTFDVPLATSATQTARYTSSPGLFVYSATLQGDGKEVVLATDPQYQIRYTVVANVIGAAGNAVNPAFNSGSFTGTRPVDSERPKVVSAVSTSNKSVMVQFSKPMADSTADPARFVIVQTVVHPEVGTVGITKAAFVPGTDRKSLLLTTLSQAEVTYQLTANNVTDIVGNPLADRTNVAGVIVDPTSFVFPGTPPSYIPCAPDAPPTCEDYDERVNSDTDALWDHEETRGWEVTIGLANGGTQTRQITSNPFSPDTDNDQLADDLERSLNTDPRDLDTDDDGLTDELEFNVYFSDPTKQDSDGDGLFDGLETSFFLTSPLFDDTDGDQLKDGYEINVNRNPKVADLPQPVLKVGETRMGLDVRFIESNGQTTRQVDAKSVEATLVQSSSQEYSYSESTTHEASTSVATTVEVGALWKAGADFGYRGHVTVTANTETTNTNSWTGAFTESSSQSTQRAHNSSLSTQQEIGEDSTVTREVVGANLQLAITLESRGNVGFSAKNLQVAALMQDPDNPTRLTPIATLVPETGLGTTFNLGPLVPPRGPIVFASTTVYPQLVDDLMNNPRGLVFRFANYDLVDEAGRNFAFTSQEVNDRTARIAIDYGGFDPDGDGRGAQSEILRVATGIIGRVVDTTGDGVIDGRDRKVVFDPSGKQVGLTLRDALAAAGLKAYKEKVNPSSTLSVSEKEGSYSTIMSDDGRTELLYRVRNRQVQPGSPKSWEIVDATGIDRSMTLDERILYPGTNVTLMFLEDVDNDSLPAVIEAVHGCKDTDRDSDDDGLDDRFETLVGWEVENPLGVREVRSKCHALDSDLDGRTDREEAPGVVFFDADGSVLFEAGSPGGTSSRSVSDLKTTAGLAAVTSASADFTVADVGRLITGAEGGPIPSACTRVLSVQSPTQATMTAKATTTASAAPATVASPYRGGCALRLATTTGSPVVTSASPSFMAQDVGALITTDGSGPIPTTCARILSVQSPTQATMTANATATATAATASMGSPYTQPCEPRRAPAPAPSATGLDANVDAALADPVTDPVGNDTDFDGLGDDFELDGYKNDLNLPVRMTSPEHPDTDGDGLSDGVERRLKGDPWVDDSDRFTDSDRDGLTDAKEVGDDDNNFVIDQAEREGAGWDVTVTRMHPRLATPRDPYSAVARLIPTTPLVLSSRRHLVDNGQSLQVGMVVDIKDETSPAAPLNTSVDKVEAAAGDDAYVTFGTAFDVKVPLSIYRTVCKNGTCPAQNSTTTARVYSSKYDPDTDDDGLTDYEESILETDPGCTERPNATGSMVLDCKPAQAGKDLDKDGVRDGWDTDGDGLTDFQEVRGFKLGNGTTVKTKPTFLDTDNDRRTDGEEAGLPGGEFIVQLPGAVLYEAFSNPIKADTDFDLLVDGDEQVFGIDPTIPNTDGDNQSDYSEIRTGRRPEVPDMRVKMNFVRLVVDKDGEKDGDAGDFKFKFYAVKADGSSVLMVHSGLEAEEGVARLPLTELPGALPLDATKSNCPAGNWADQCWVTTVPSSGPQTIVRIHDASSVPFTLDGTGREILIGSVSTTNAVPEQFGVKGYVMEFDGDPNDRLTCRVDIFPDVLGNEAEGTGLMKGSDLRLGVWSMAIRRSGVTCDDGPLDFTLGVTYTAE